jgi:cyanate permease
MNQPTSVRSRIKEYWTQGMEMKFWIAFLTLMSIWFVGIVTSNTYNGYIHILAVFGIVSLAIWLFQRHRAARIQRAHWNR